MKVIRILVILVLLSSAMYAQDKNVVGVTKKIIRVVEHKITGEDNWKEIEKQVEPLYNGDEVRTHKRSLAIVQFSDGAILRVRPLSLLHVYGEKKQRKLDKNIEITEGSVNFDYPKGDDNGEMTFTTPTSVASIRGTTGLIVVGKGKESTFFLLSGSMLIESKLGDKASETLQPGQKASVGSDGEIIVEAMSNDEKEEVENSAKDNKNILELEIGDKKLKIEYLTK